MGPVLVRPVYMVNIARLRVGMFITTVPDGEMG